MPGAAILAAKAALLSGAGLVTLASTRRVASAAASAVPDILLQPFAAVSGALSVSASAPLVRYAAERRANAAALGPGLSLKNGARALVRRLVAALEIPFVLDADGLGAFAGDAAALRARRAPAVLTPHEGEFKRLFGVDVPANVRTRASLAKRTARAYSIVLVLKGHRTVVTDGRRVRVNVTGNPGMAKGGTGDVLTGMIAAFLAQGLESFEAAAWAVDLHGRAGDRLAKKTSELSVTASGLLGELPAVFRHAARVKK